MMLDSNALWPGILVFEYLSRNFSPRMYKVKVMEAKGSQRMAMGSFEGGLGGGRDGRNGSKNMSKCAVKMTGGRISRDCK